MKKLVSMVLVLAVIISLGSTLFAGTASAEKVYSLKLAHNDPVDSNEDKLAKYFEELVETRSNGRIQVDVYPAAQLGDENAMVESTQMNAVQMTIPSAGAAARFYSPLNIFMMPFYLDGANEEEKYANLSGAVGSVWEDLNAGLIQQSNLRLTGLFWYGDRTVTNNVRPIEKASDLQGINLRVPDQELYTQVFRALGATTTPIAYGELYMALSLGVVDGQDNPVANIIVKKMYEVQKYLTVTGHISQVQLPVISERFYQSLPEDLQKLILECMEEACVYGSNLNTRDNMAMVDTCVEMGMILSQPDRASFVEASKNVPSIMLDEEGMKFFEILKASLEEVYAAK